MEKKINMEAQNELDLLKLRLKEVERERELFLEQRNELIDIIETYGGWVRIEDNAMTVKMRSLYSPSSVEEEAVAIGKAVADEVEDIIATH